MYTTAATPLRTYRMDCSLSGSQTAMSASASPPNVFSNAVRDLPITRYGRPFWRSAAATLLPIAPVAPTRAIVSMGWRRSTRRLDQALGMFLAPFYVEEMNHALAMGNEPVGDV